MNDITYVGKHSLIHSVSRHAHESWEYVYCTSGSGTFTFDDATLPYQEGDIVLIPPMVPHSNASEVGFTNIHINMTSPMVSLKVPTVVTDDENHFLLDAFRAAHYHFYRDGKDRLSLLACYGNLISCCLVACQNYRQHRGVVDDIERTILASYTDCNFELDTYLHSLPFSYDYLRKLFQKELGVTPHQFLSDSRLQIAAEALAHSGTNGNSVADIALMCGFRDPLYFSKMFKKRYGVAPSFYYQRQHAEGDWKEETQDTVKVVLRDE